MISANWKREWPRPRTQCKECEATLVLRWGKHKRPHFAHLPGRSTESMCLGIGGESTLHELAKKLVASHLKTGGLLKIKTTCGNCERHAIRVVRCKREAGEEVKMEYVHTEAPKTRLDVCVIKDVQIIFAIEIKSAHKATTATRAPIPWFEIDACEIVDVFKNSSLAENCQSSVHINCLRQDRSKCSNTMCWEVLGMASMLGYTFKHERYESINDKERDAAMRGKYALPTRCWETHPDSDDEDERPKISWSLKRLVWRELINRGKCARCEKRFDIKWGKPYCTSCFKKTRDEAHEDIGHEWVTVSAEEKKQLRSKYNWLSSFDESAPGTPCQLCQDQSGGCTFWFGNRSVCNACFASWTPEKTKQYLTHARKRKNDFRRDASYASRMKMMESMLHVNDAKS